MPDKQTALDNLRSSRWLSALAEREREAAIAEAVDAGYGYPEIARELGVSRQAVRQYVERRRKA